MNYLTELKLDKNSIMEKYYKNKNSMSFTLEEDEEVNNCIFFKNSL